MLIKKLIVFCLLCITLFTQPLFAKNTDAPEAIFFDMDGVLVDTEELKFQAWQEALKSKLGLDVTLAEYIPLVGLSSEAILNQILKSKPDLAQTTIDKPSLINYKNTLYKAKQAQGVPAIPNTVALLKNLLKRKQQYQVKIGIVSSASHSEILKNLEFIGIDVKSLDAVASGDDDLKDIVDPEGTNKPKPYIYQKIATILKVNPENCVVFEDTNAGVIAAHLAKMRVYAIPNLFTKDHDFSFSEGVIGYNGLQYQSTASNLLQTGYMHNFIVQSTLIYI